ncbi:MAG: primosomal protein N' (replication factor Y) - superfamily II helicase [Brevirhabdus sp.]
MFFDPNSGALVCGHCGHTEQIEMHGQREAALAEIDFEGGVSGLSDAEYEERRTLTCDNCGAHFEAPEDVHSTECPFCATPVVTDTGVERLIKPQGVLPFGIPEPDARKAMTDWLGRLWFAPNGLQEYARKGRKMNGMYVPYWTYDADTKSRYTGQRGTVYYVTRTVMREGRPHRIQEQKIRWTPTSGNVARFFDDVLVLASTSLPKSYTDNLAPWDLGGLEPYAPEYLAGFRAEGYTVPLDDGFTEAHAHMTRVIRRDVKFAIGGDRQRIDSLHTNMSDVTFKHVLLPVWLAAYKYRGKTYRFVVNGRTGKVQGERPWSVWKIAGTVVVGALVAAAIGYVVATTQG